MRLPNRDHCNPLVREITFENGEELTEEGLPFLLLFYDPDDHSPVDDFTNVIKTRSVEKHASPQSSVVPRTRVPARNCCELWPGFETQAVDFGSCLVLIRTQRLVVTLKYGCQNIEHAIYVPLV